MSSFAIPDFSADFGRDSGSFNVQNPKARAADAQDRADRADTLRESDDDREPNNFDRALRDSSRDAADAREQQKTASRAPVRERAPANEGRAADKPDAVSKTEDGAGDQPEQTLDAPAHAGAPKAAVKNAAKPQTKQSEQAGAAKTIALELSTQVVIAKKPDAAAPVVIAPEGEASADATDGRASSGEKKSASDLAAVKSDACAVPAQTNIAAASNANVEVQTDAAAAAGLLSALTAPAQTQNQKPAGDSPAQTDAAAAPAIEPELLGAPKAAAPKPAGAQDGQNLAAPGQAAQAEAFTAALGKQEGPGAKPAAAEKAEGGNHSAAANATPAAAAPNAAQQAVLQNVVKASEAVAAKEAAGSAPKAADVKTADGKTDSAPLQQFSAATGADDARRPTAANTTHAANNTETVAKSVVHFFRQSNGGSARFEIRLDPVELGRVDARVEVHSDKTVSLTLSADRPETLQELMRTARELEKQLTDAGMKLSDDGVKFRLNTDAQNGQERQNAQLESEPRRARGIYNDAEPVIDVSANMTLRRYRAGGIDVLA